MTSGDRVPANGTGAPGGPPLDGPGSERPESEGPGSAGALAAGEFETASDPSGAPGSAGSDEGHEAERARRQAERRRRREAERLELRRERAAERERERLEALGTLEDLTLPWPKWADGKVHRLKRGRHYMGNVRAVQEEAERAAALLGKGVRVMREELGGSYEYLYFQFADQRLDLGEPCRCGNTELLRVHAAFGRCPRCGRTIVFAEK